MAILDKSNHIRWTVKNYNEIFTIRETDVSISLLNTSYYYIRIFNEPLTEHLEQPMSF